ncbi:peptide deformylase [Caballeronia udeis]|uniref:peptide deformylase n=1 Tax=Caballeronia udeis TaxID=1232866 RepID=UPI0007803CF0
MKREFLPPTSPLLRETASPVTTFWTAKLQTLIDDMFDTMRSGQGIGLAARKIGVSERIIVFEIVGGSRASVAPPRRWPTSTAQAPH